MAKLSEERISEIRKAYARIGTYSGVAKELGCSAATVKKYVTMVEVETKKEPESKVLAPEFDWEVNPPFFTEVDFSFEREKWTTLSKEESTIMADLMEKL